MKHIRTYEEIDSIFDIEEAMNKIKEEYSEDDVAGLLDEEIMNWVEDDWNDDFESEYDWYQDFGHGEAEDVVRNSIIDWYMTNSGKQLSIDNKMVLSQRLQDHYSPNLGW